MAALSSMNLAPPSTDLVRALICGAAEDDDHGGVGVLVPGPVAAPVVEPVEPPLVSVTGTPARA